MPNFNKFFYDLAYRMGTPRWDSGAVPPEVIAQVERNHARTALDLGCGTGTNAIYLAQQGLNVVGVDFTLQAIEAAREKAKRANVSVDFHLGDVTRLDYLRQPFDLILDVGCFHGLDQAGRKRYIENLVRLTHPDSVFMLWGFDGLKFFGTYGLTLDQVRREFAPHFVVSQIASGTNGSKHDGQWYRLVRQGETV
ncbi:MAG: class I SAM-dependent methyltransferase [Chloroflexi bacterium]|nr:class I SAM-dependent methyltransferase [Chloroflexota bacterium]